MVISIIIIIDDHYYKACLNGGWVKSIDVDGKDGYTFNVISKFINCDQ